MRGAISMLAFLIRNQKAVVPCPQGVLPKSSLRV